MSMNAVAAPRVDTTPLSGPEKAAILLMYLDHQVARELLGNLGDGEVKQLGLALASIQHVDSEVIERVVGDFVAGLSQVATMPYSGRDYAKKVLPTLVEETRRDLVVGAINRRIATDFEDFIRGRTPLAVAAVLAEEHPQVRAVALLRMGPENAARVIAAFDEDAQVDLTVRMARAERVSGDLADDVEAAVRRALEDQDDSLPIGGAEVAARVLGKLPRERNTAVLTRLRDNGNVLADQLQKLMVVFEDLGSLDDRGIQALLRVVQRGDLVLALKGASVLVRDRFLKNLSTRAAQDLREEMEVGGTPRRASVRAAQEAITGAAQRLADEGAIVLGFGEDG